MNYPGSIQPGLGKRLLDEYPWWRCRTAPEWASEGRFAGRIPGDVRLASLPRRNICNWSGSEVKDMDDQSRSDRQISTGNHVDEEHAIAAGLAIGIGTGETRQ